MLTNKMLKELSVTKCCDGCVDQDCKTLAADLIRCRELLAGMVAGAFNDDATELEHTLDCPGEGCTLCDAKKYLTETEG